MTEDGGNPFRPWSPHEIEQAKNDYMRDYHRGATGLVSTLKEAGHSLEWTPDEAKYQLSNTPDQAPNVESLFDLHKFNECVSKEKSGPRARPLGNFPQGHEQWDLQHVTKDVLDSSITAGQGGGVLVRTDLVPTIYLWLNTRFPGLERFQRIPANGLYHTWNNQIDFGDANDDFMDEFGCPTVSHGAYFQGQTNIAILAIERGTTLKLQYAVQQSGMRYNGTQTVADLEMMNAVLSRAKILQKDVYMGTTLTGHNGADEYGKTFVNGFNGLRVLISNHANETHQGFYPAGFGPVINDCNTNAGGSITQAIDFVAGQIMDNGGMPTAIHLSTRAEQKLRNEGLNLVRYTEDNLTIGGGLVLGGRVRAVDTVAGLLPIVIVPGGGIGSYAIGGGDGSTFATGTQVEDIYVLSEPYLQMPYLGSPDPVPIEIPLGVPSADGTGCLTRKFIVWWMVGLAMPVPIFQGKVRIPQA